MQKKILFTLHLLTLLFIISCGSSGSRSQDEISGGESNSPTSSNDSSFQTGSECEESNSSSCEGSICLGLSENDQGLSGMCSKSCTGSNQCGTNQACINVPQLGGFCLLRCQSDRDCLDGFVCSGEIEDGKVCYITENNPQTPNQNPAPNIPQNPNPTTGGNCSNCSVYTDDRLGSYCSDSSISATKLCDCFRENSSAGAGCVAASSGANLYCCR